MRDGRVEILVVDDERLVRERYRFLLECEGYSVTTVASGAAALAHHRAHAVDLVLLDVMMPAMSGVSVCQALRHEDAHTPVLFVTAAATDALQVRALGLGADDFLDKACSDEVLLARVAAALRRAGLAFQPKGCATPVKLGAVTVDLTQMRIVDEVGHSVELTRGEGQILKELLDRRGQYVSADRLFSCVHGMDSLGDPGCIRKLIYRLRDKLGSARDFIQNCTSAGYRVVKP